MISVEQIHQYNTRERVAQVAEVLDDGTLVIEYQNGKRGRAQPNGTGDAELYCYLVDLFEGIEQELGAAYIVIQKTPDDLCILWVPDDEGNLQRLHTLLIDAGVLIPEEL